MATSELSVNQGIRQPAETRRYIQLYGNSVFRQSAAAEPKPIRACAFSVLCPATAIFLVTGRVKTRFFFL